MVAFVMLHRASLRLWEHIAFLFGAPRNNAAHEIRKFHANATQEAHDSTHVGFCNWITFRQIACLLPRKAERLVQRDSYLNFPGSEMRLDCLHDGTRKQARAFLRSVLKTHCKTPPCLPCVLSGVCSALDLPAVDGCIA